MVPSPPEAAVAIRPAHDAEAPACRALLPEAFGPTDGPVLYVAVGDGAIVGAAAIGWVPGGFPVQVHVVPAWRRRGVGRALVDAAAAAAAGETARLRAWTLLAEDSPAERFLLATGFAAARRFHGFDTGFEFAAHVARVRAYLERSGRIPDGVAVVAPSAAPRAELVALVAANLHAVPAAVAARVAADGPSGYDDTLSVVLMHDGRVAGATLSSRDGAVGRIEVNVVAPALRGGWANIILLDETARRGIAGGIERFRFFSDETTRDTMNLGRRTGARFLGVGLVMERPLG